MIEVLLAGAVAISALAVRSLLRPAPAGNHHVEHEYRAARAIVEEHGRDSLSPFVLRPDKALLFAAGGILSYRVIRGTAIVSSDPVAPPAREPEVLAALPGAGPPPRLAGRAVGRLRSAISSLPRARLRTLCTGEEAIVDPAGFTLEGRAVRKLRQSVHRVDRRGWEITVHDGRAIDAELEAEIDALEDTWRSSRPRLHGFAMGMGAYECRPAARRRVRAGPLAGGRAGRGDAVRRPLRQPLARHHAPGRRDPERAQRGHGLPRARARPRARHRPGQPQLRRARPPRARRSRPRAARPGGRRAGDAAALASLPDGAAGPLQPEVLASLAAALSGLPEPRGAAAHRAARAPGRGLPARPAGGCGCPGGGWRCRARCRAQRTPRARGSRRHALAAHPAGRWCWRSRWCWPPSGWSAPTATGSPTTSTAGSPPWPFCRTPTGAGGWRSTSTRRRCTARPTTWSICRRATTPRTTAIPSTTCCTGARAGRRSTTPSPTWTCGSTTSSACTASAR